MSDSKDILDEARDFLRPHGSADEVARYPTASLVLRLADELRAMRAANDRLRGLCGLSPKQPIPDLMS